MKKRISFLLCITLMLTMIVPFGVSAIDAADLLEVNADSYYEEVVELVLLGMNFKPGDPFAQYVGQETFVLYGVPMCGIKEMLVSEMDQYGIYYYSYEVTVDTSKMAMGDAISLLNQQKTAIDWVDGETSVELSVYFDRTYGYGTGDVNGNGELDAFDYLYVKRAYFGTYELSFEEKGRANASASDDGNEVIDQFDYLKIKVGYIAGTNPYGDLPYDD